MYDKKIAREKLFEAIEKVKINENKGIVRYRGFDLEIGYNLLTNEHNFSLNGFVKHFGDLGTSADCNITRFDNAIELLSENVVRLQEKLQATKE